MSLTSSISTVFANSRISSIFMNTFDRKTSIAFNLATNIYGFVYTSKKDKYNIVLNGNLIFKTQFNTFVHELTHIAIDIPTAGYVMVIDMQHDIFEKVTKSVILYMG